MERTVKGTYSAPNNQNQRQKKLKVKALIDSRCTNTIIARKTVEEKGILLGHSHSMAANPKAK